MKQPNQAGLTDDLEFLHGYLQRLQQWYNLCAELSYEDLCILPGRGDGAIAWDAEAERVARLADANQIDGSLFRDYLVGAPDPNPVSASTAKQLAKKIVIVAQIIGKIEQPGPATQNTSTPGDARLLSVAQVAQMLGRGESTIREMDRKGLVPRPVRLGGSIRWNVDELNVWLKHGCPPRAEWERHRDSLMQEVDNATT